MEIAGKEEPGTKKDKDKFSSRTDPVWPFTKKIRFYSPI